MNIELYIIRKLLIKEAFYKYRKYIKIKEPKELCTLYTVLDKMQDSLSRDISITEFCLLAQQEDSSLVPLLEQLKNDEVGDDVLEEMLQKQVERQWAYDVALLAVAVNEGRADASELVEMSSSLPCIETDIGLAEFVTDDIDEIMAGVDRRTGGIRWRMPNLDHAIGGLRQGDFGFIFARPETGKTTFLASEVSHFATQTDRPVIWFNNEEAGLKVKGRMIQGALGWTTEQMSSRKTHVMPEFMRLTHGNLKLKDTGHLHKKDVERILEEYKPALIVYDQIDKIKGFKADRDDLLLGAIYQWARELAKEYAPTIGVCQASATAENKRWLAMDDIAKSKTEKAAEGDFIIGIGKLHDVGSENIRYLHVIKNKLTGIHARLECTIDPDRARYKDL